MWLFLPNHKLELMFSSIEPYAPRRCYLRSNLFLALCTTNTYSYHPLFLPANAKIACTCFSDCQPISSVQSSPVYAGDPSRSSLAIQSSCWTQALISPPTLHVPLISLPLPLSDRELFCRPLAHNHSIGDVIPSTSIVKNEVIQIGRAHV